jgi:hypothetical protein
MARKLKELAPGEEVKELGPGEEVEGASAWLGG